MSYNYCLLLSKRIKKAYHVTDKVKQSITFNRLWAIGFPIASHVRRNSMEASFCKRFELMTPGIPTFRKAMTEQNQWTFPLFGDMDTNSVAVKSPVMDISHIYTF